MDDIFKYTLKDNQPKHYRTQRWMFLVLGVLYTINGFIHVFESDTENLLFAYIWLVAGVLMILFGYLNKKQVEEFKIEFSSEGINSYIPGIKLKQSNRIKLHWSEIQKFKIEPLKIVLTLNDNRSKEFSIDSLGYNDVKQIKAEFSKFAQKYLNEQLV